MNGERAVVLLSGGQDSATCLFWARDNYDEILALSIDYGQVHRVELEAARKLARLAECKSHDVLPLDTLTALGAASLTNVEIPSLEDAKGTGNVVAAERGLPSSFVPGRNILLLGIAAAYALQHGSEKVVTGVCATDRQGYPDCRAEFVDAIAQAIAIGTDTPNFGIVAPVLSRTKAETWQLAKEHGALEFVRKLSRTCYLGSDESNEWGFGCGKCPACEARAEGWAEWLRVYA